MLAFKILFSIYQVFFLANFAFGQDDWQLGPFTKHDEVNPILGPLNETKFYCPVQKLSLHWENKDVFNPTAAVVNNRVFLFYRAEDDVGVNLGTSRMGLAISTDGLNFNRKREPIFYPTEGEYLHFEWEGGCEDPRIVEDENGTYYVTYTGYDGDIARLMIASSSDLKNWTKHGLTFKDPAYRNMWSKAGSIVTRHDLKTGRFIATKINGKYIMYFGDTSIFMAESDDLIYWRPIIDPQNNLLPIFRPRARYFDSDLVEPGPQPILRDDGILLIYNSRNSGVEGIKDPELPDWTYTAGQILFNSSDPTQVLKRSDNYFIKPEKDYELVGQVGNVVFLEGLVHYKGHWFLYYGTADSYIAVASTMHN